MDKADIELIKLVKKKALDISDGATDMADVDQLRIFINAKPSLFPEGIRDVAVTKVSTHAARQSLGQRVLAIYDALEAIPPELAKQEFADPNDQRLIPTFELTKQDAERIFELCNDMRKIILASSSFDEPHRVRLLNRIAAIESETHKPAGMFDVVRGGVNDLGETLGKFGQDIKPLTDRMKEVVSIARKGSKQYEQLPEPEEIKQLPAPDQDNQE